MILNLQHCKVRIYFSVVIVVISSSNQHSNGKKPMTSYEIIYNKEINTDIKTCGKHIYKIFKFVIEATWNKSSIFKKK